MNYLHNGRKIIATYKIRRAPAIGGVEGTGKVTARVPCLVGYCAVPRDCNEVVGKEIVP